jgi:hypothetical protein
MIQHVVNIKFMNQNPAFWQTSLQRTFCRKLRVCERGIHLGVGRPHAKEELDLEKLNSLRLPETLLETLRKTNIQTEVLVRGKTNKIGFSIRADACQREEERQGWAVAAKNNTTSDDTMITAHHTDRPRSGFKVTITDPDYELLKRGRLTKDGVSPKEVDAKTGAKLEAELDAREDVSIRKLSENDSGNIILEDDTTKEDLKNVINGIADEVDTFITKKKELQVHCESLPESYVEFANYVLHQLEKRLSLRADDTKTPDNALQAFSDGNIPTHVSETRKWRELYTEGTIDKVRSKHYTQHFLNKNRGVHLTSIWSRSGLINKGNQEEFDRIFTRI